MGNLTHCLKSSDRNRTSDAHPKCLRLKPFIQRSGSLSSPYLRALHMVAITPPMNPVTSECNVALTLESRGAGETSLILYITVKYTQLKTAFRPIVAFTPLENATRPSSLNTFCIQSNEFLYLPRCSFACNLTLTT
ncbi:hypothetical protein ACHAXM_004135 [Skeletonema potamos]